MSGGEKKTMDRVKLTIDGTATDGETGLLHDVDQQLRIFLRGVHAVRGDDGVALVGVCSRHIGLSTSRGH